jgi:hypothetical protein
VVSFSHLLFYVCSEWLSEITIYLNYNSGHKLRLEPGSGNSRRQSKPSSTELSLQFPNQTAAVSNQAGNRTESVGWKREYVIDESVSWKRKYVLWLEGGHVPLSN